MKCSNCGADAEEDARFCPECGFNLNESKTENTSNNPTNNGIKSKGVLSFLDDWNEWSTGKKIGSLIVACCIGLIIIGTIGGIIFPDLNTSEHRFYMTNSSFVIPDGCTIRESGIGPGMAILIKEDGQEVFVEDQASQDGLRYDIVDKNETIDADGVNVYKITYRTSKNAESSIGYFFTKDNIDYWIRSSPGTEIDDNFVISIVKTMDTVHGSANDHENKYPSSSSDTTSHEVNNVEVDKNYLTEDEYNMFAFDHTKDYTINGKKGHLYVGPYHDGGADVEFYYKDSGSHFCLSACDDPDKALEKMEKMV